MLLISVLTTTGWKPGKNGVIKKLNSHTGTSKEVLLHMMLIKKRKEKKKPQERINKEKELLRGGRGESFSFAWRCQKSLHVSTLDLLHIKNESEEAEGKEKKFEIQSAFAQHQDVRDIIFNVFQGYQTCSRRKPALALKPREREKKAATNLRHEERRRRIMKNTSK